MTYTVTKYEKDRWYVISQYGTKMGPFKTKSEATKVARVLAGWRGKVEVA